MKQPYASDAPRQAGMSLGALERLAGVSMALNMLLSGILNSGWPPPQLLGAILTPALVVLVVLFLSAVIRCTRRTRANLLLAVMAFFLLTNLAQLAETRVRRLTQPRAGSGDRGAPRQIVTAR